jgi:nitrogen fixation/metabolism regulation signal transduction histidine kinase
MVYKRLFIQVIIRVVLLLSTCIVLARIIFSAAYVHSSIVVSGILIVETLEIVWYLNRTNRQLAQFFSSLSDRASSLKFDGFESGSSFRDLSLRLEQISKLFQKERREKEAQHNYLNYLVEQIGVGIITFRDDGRIDLINPAAKTIFADRNIPELASLNKYNPEFEKLIRDLELNEKALIRIIVKNELFYLTVQKSLFKLEDKSYWLISFQDINSELDKKELDAWQKIIRVLTHEIMSSISPVTSLSEHLLNKIQDPNKPGIVKKPDGKLMEDLGEGLEIIKTRGEGLMEFVRHYHSLTHLPTPVLEEVQLGPFLEKILSLIDPECKKNNISLMLEIREPIQTSIDPQLIEQVLLNLIRNSIQALEGIGSGKSISIFADSDVTGIQVSIRDNGCGIDIDNMDNIFIPFYTTRTKGSGIGLSFAKQIMRLHNGKISVKSDKGKGAEFILRF